MARILVEWIVWDLWKIDHDEDHNDEVFYVNSELQTAQWEKPWSPQVTMDRIVERRRAKKKAELLRKTSRVEN